jgi:hypothetical protein
LRFEAISQRTKQHWNKFWSEGGAIDLSESTDARWRELERRIVLSQYLTAIQCAGTLPPQETALTFNSWEGKFHLENALVARCAFRSLEPHSDVRAQPGLLSEDTAQGSRNSTPAGI